MTRLVNFQFFLTFSFFLSLQSFGCGNEYMHATNAKGEIIEVDMYSHSPNGFYSFKNGFDTQLLSEVKNDFLQKISKRIATYEDFSDLALIELKIGDRKYAVKILDSLYRIYSNEYNIVANLGTGYELIGDNTKALQLIEKAVRLNPESHNYSEWIHVEILKQKLKNKPDYSSIMKLDFKGSLSAVYNEFHLPQNEKRLNELVNKKNALIFQLSERIAFIAPEDKCVGQLLFDLAEIQSITNSLDQSKLNYELALKYDPALESKTSERLKEVKTQIYWSRIKDSKYEILCIMIVVTLLFYTKKLFVIMEEFRFEFVFISYLTPLLLFFPLLKIAKYLFYQMDAAMSIAYVNFVMLSILSLILFFSFLKNPLYILLLKLQMTAMVVILLLALFAHTATHEFSVVSVFAVSFLSVLVPHAFLRYLLKTNTPQ